MFPGYLSEIEMAYKPTRFIDTDQDLIQLLNDIIRYRHGFDAEEEIHTLLIENKCLRDQIDDNDNSKDNS
jgi:hypothetical protein